MEVAVSLRSGNCMNILYVTVLVVDPHSTDNGLKHFMGELTYKAVPAPLPDHLLI